MRKLSDITDSAERECIEKLQAGEVYDTGWRLMTWAKMPENLKEFYSRRQQQLREEKSTVARSDTLSDAKPGNIVFRKILERYGAEEDMRVPTPADHALMAYSVSGGRVQDIVLATEAPCKLSAAFLHDIAMGTLLNENGARLSFPRGLRLNGVIVDDIVDFQLMTSVPSVELWQCWMPGGFTFTRCHLSHLSLSECWASWINGDQSRVDGGLSFVEVQVENDLSLAGARINGGLDLCGGRIGKGLSFIDAVIEGRARLSSFEADGATDQELVPLVIEGTIWLRGTTIRGALTFDNVEARGEIVALYVNSSQLLGGVEASGAEKRPGGVGEGGKAGMPKWVPGLRTTRGAIAFIQCNVAGGCRLQGAQLEPYVSGAIDIAESDWVGIAFWMRDCKVDGPLRLTTANPATPRGQRPDIKGLVSVRNTVVSGDLELWGARFHALESAAATKRFSSYATAIELLGVHVKHDLRFDEPPPPSTRVKGETAAHIEGAAILGGCRIDGDVVLGQTSWTGKPRDDEKKEAGSRIAEACDLPIVLSFCNSEIGGDIRIKSVEGKDQRVGVVDLTGAKLRAFLDDGGRAWGDKPDVDFKDGRFEAKTGVGLLLDGCNYQRFAGGGSRLNWLKRQQPTGLPMIGGLRWPQYSEPHHTAARVLHAGGNYLQAREALGAGLGLRKFFGYNVVWATGLLIALFLIGWGGAWAMMEPNGAAAESAQVTALEAAEQAPEQEASQAPVRSRACDSDFAAAYAIDAMLVGINLGPEERCSLGEHDSRTFFGVTLGPQWLYLLKLGYGIVSTIFLVLFTLAWTRFFRREL